MLSRPRFAGLSRLLLLSLALTVVGPDHWDVSLPGFAEGSHHHAEGHERHCHGDAANCSDVPVPPLGGLAGILSDAGLPLGAGTAWVRIEAVAHLLVAIAVPVAVPPPESDAVS
jgi:hypothetical protein